MNSERRAWMGATVAWLCSIFSWMPRLKLRSSGTKDELPRYYAMLVCEDGYAVSHLTAEFEIKTDCYGTYYGATWDFGQPLPLVRIACFEVCDRLFNKVVWSSSRQGLGSRVFAKADFEDVAFPCERRDMHYISFKCPEVIKELIDAEG